LSRCATPAQASSEARSMRTRRTPPEAGAGPCGGPAITRAGGDDAGGDVVTASLFGSGLHFGHALRRLAARHL
jgi:hypothetical protein